MLRLELYNTETNEKLSSIDTDSVHRAVQWIMSMYRMLSESRRSNV